jgi:transposase
MTMKKSTSFTWEEREKIIQRTLSPENISISSLAKEIGISATALYEWKNKLQQKNSDINSNNKRSKQWSSADKFHIVVETHCLNEADLSAYCRQKGLYVEQVHAWKRQCLTANETISKDISKIESDLKEERNRSKQLEKELSRKEKALAETAALLVLRKKGAAIWGDNEDE